MNKNNYEINPAKSPVMVLENIICIFIVYYSLIGFFIENKNLSFINLGIFKKPFLGSVELILIFFTVYTLYHFYSHKLKFRFVYLILGLLGILALYSLVYNQKFLPVINGIRFYFRGLVFLLIPLVFKVSRVLQKKIFKLLKIIAYIQIPATIYQFVILKYAHISGGSFFDFISGTFPGRKSGMLGVFLLFVMVIIFICDYLKKKNLLLTIGKVSLLAVPMVLSNSKVIVHLIIISLVFMFFSRRIIEYLNFNFWHFLGRLLIVFIVLIMVLHVGYSISYDEDLLKFFLDFKERIYIETKLSEYLAEKEDPRKRYGRLESVEKIFKKNSASTRTLLLGQGLGSMTRGIIPELEGVQFSAGKVRSTSVFILGELGIFGLILFLCAFLFLFYINLIVAKKHPFFSLINYYFLLLMLVMVVYNDGLQSSNIFHITFLLFQGISIRFYLGFNKNKAKLL